MSTRREGRYYLPHLDGMRGVVVVLVVFYHLGFSMTRHAWLCISTFFSLSGLLITGITVESFESTGKVEVVRFWARRVARLFPALLLTVAACALTAKIRKLDAVDAWFERQDLLYALVYMSNINMVFFRKDDYFAGFQSPSIMRHTWTLSIEEQYYFVWPILIFGLTSFHARSRQTPFQGGIALSQQAALLGGAEDQAKESEESVGLKALDPEADDDLVLPEGDRMRPCLLLLVAGEAAVILLSHLATLETITELGMSAAYYASWSRAGDFACGGLVFLLVRLNPSLYQRYSRQPDLPQMSTGYRALLEALFGLCVCLMLFPPMIQLPLSTMLPFYFYWFRLPFSFAIMALSVAGAVQTSAPLPAWALFSRAMTSTVMTTLGVISYGVYLFHWPLILSLGGAVAQVEEPGNPSPSAGTGMQLGERLAGPGSGGGQPFLFGLARSLWLALLSVAAGYVSHTYLEKPLMALGARQKRPWTVVAAGLAASACTAALVLAMLSYGEDPNRGLVNDWDAVAGSLAAPTNGSNHAALGVSSRPARTDVALATAPLAPLPDPAIVEDEKRTPIILVPGGGRLSEISIRSILDKYAAQVNAWPKFDDLGRKEPDQVLSELEKRQTRLSILVVCKSAANISPCGEFKWKRRVHWVWLSHNLICGDAEAWWAKNLSLPQARAAWAARCPEALDVTELDMPDTPKVESVDSLSYSGRTPTDILVLLRLAVAVSEWLPGAVNMHSVAQLRVDLRAAEARERVRAEAAAMEGLGGAQLKVLVMGESIAGVMANTFKDLIQLALPCVHRRFEQDSTARFPSIDVVNLANGGSNMVMHWVPCSVQKACDPREAKTRKRVLSGIAMTRPDALIIHDIHWKSGGPHNPSRVYGDGSAAADHEARLGAMEAMLAEAKKQGVLLVIFVTSQPFPGRGALVRVATEQDMLAELVQRLQPKQCKPGGRKPGLMLAVMDWHRLLCPNLTPGQTTGCKHAVHGFDDVMPDGMHPRGPGGQWVCAQLLSVALGQVAHTLLPGYTESWDAALSNPLVTCLQEQLQHDGKPPLDSLHHQYWVCPRGVS